MTRIALPLRVTHPVDMFVPSRAPAAVAIGGCADGSGNWLPMINLMGGLVTVCPSDPRWPLAVQAHKDGTWKNPRPLGNEPTPTFPIEDQSFRQKMGLGSAIACAKGVVLPADFMASGQANPVPKAAPGTAPAKTETKSVIPWVLGAAAVGGLAWWAWSSGALAGVGIAANPTTFKKGDRVTSQPPTWSDGDPVKSWPKPGYLGTILKIENLRGVPTAYVKWDSGPKHYESLRNLYLVGARGLQDYANPGRARKLGVRPADVDPKELARGTEHEMEHTDSKRVAARITLDHLAETWERAYLQARKSGASDSVARAHAFAVLKHAKYYGHLDKMEKLQGEEEWLYALERSTFRGNPRYRYRVMSGDGFQVAWEGDSLREAKAALARARHTDGYAFLQFYEPGSADSPGDWFNYKERV